MDFLREAVALHKRCPVIDGHADSVLAVLGGQRTLIQRSDKGHIDWPRAREGGLTCTVQAAWIDPVYYPVAARRVGEAIDGLLRQIAAGEGVRLALRAEDITAAHEDGGLAVLLNIEGAEGIQGSLALLRNYYRLGVRMMGLVWNHRNEVAEGVGEPESGGGLTRFGREVVREMNRLGMLIDLAHITPRGFFDVLELSEDPVLFTHGNCHALHEHPRNLTDEQIKALASHGGVFGVSFVASFMGKEKASLTTVADHIDHVCQLLGNADHVGLGSDFDGADMPPGLEDVTRLPELTAELLRRGYREEDMAKVLGGNYLRVFRQVLG
ncbi:MAG: dipeptidase [Symbiobacterium sp.]|uniref:dipeptidase n=1 Tax=Symbiobacterium sp. TaxID=1971213 RepID=UPI003463C054